MRLDWFFHGVPLIFAGAAAAFALFQGLYGNAHLWCWIEPSYDEYQMVLFYAPLWMMIGVVTVSTFLVFDYH